MSDLYVIGREDGSGLVAIGLAEDAKAKLAELQEGSKEPLRLLRTATLERGWDTLAQTILRRDIAGHEAATGWYRIPASRAKHVADKAFRATQVKKKNGKTNFGPLVSKIRTQVFGCSMEVLATIAGTATSTVSRWEKGELSPGLDEIKRMRAFAYQNGLAWNDHILFEDA